MNLKNLLAISLIMTILMGCRNSESGSDNKPSGIETLMSFSISLPKTSGQRTLPEDYNPDGTYAGNDYIETLDVYMKSSEGIIEAKRFLRSDLSYNGSVISPGQPFRTTSGYKTIYIVLNRPGPLETSVSEENELIDTTGLARYKDVGGDLQDLIMMTGKSVSGIYIEPGVSIQEVNSGMNKIPVSVSRIVSRVIVTTTASADVINSEDIKIGTMSGLNFSIAQGTNKVYWLPQAGYTTWGSGYVPELGTYIGQAQQYYDYSGLDVQNAIPLKPVSGDGYKDLKGLYLFENTHKEGTLDDTEYRKGNTAYVLVRGKFTPDPAAIADGGALTGGTFYVGQADGLIYSSRQAAHDAILNQRVATYEEGKVLYFAWLNPDDIAKPLNSPVVRNNIYHINITAFRSVGYNWNPLYPEDPDTTTPQNPDPKPGNLFEPDSPISPVDPLTPEETYMNVEVTVLDWTAHSYDIEF